MKKWQLLIEDDYDQDAWLICTDVGEITSVSLNYDLPEDSITCVPYVSGIVVADGVKIPIYNKLSAVIRKRGIIMLDDSWKNNPNMLPNQIPVVYSHMDQNKVQKAETIDKNSLIASYNVDWNHADYILADPRVIWMSFYTAGKDPWLTTKLCMDIPTMEEAIANLRSYGLYPRDVELKDGVWGLLVKIWGSFVRKHHEEAFAQTWGRTAHFEKKEILPDSNRDIYLKTIHIVKQNEVPHFDYFLMYLHPSNRIKLVREPDNSLDSNAVQVVVSFPYEWKLGYVSHADAAEFAPNIDNGITYVGWIKSVDRENKQISIDIYKHIQFPVDNITNIHFIQDGFK